MAKAGSVGSAGAPGWGGARAGAGRKFKGETPESVARQLRKAIDDTLSQAEPVTLTEPLLRHMCLQALATIYDASRRGNLKASFYLCDRMMGAPERPFAEMVEQLSPEEAAVALVRMFVDRGFSVELSQQIARVLGAPAPEVAEATPIPKWMLPAESRRQAATTTEPPRGKPTSPLAIELAQKTAPAGVNRAFPRRIRYQRRLHQVQE